VSLTAAAGAGQYQPASGFSGECLGSFAGGSVPLLVNGVAASSLRYQVLKGEVFKRAQVAVTLQAVLAVRL